MKTYSQSKQDIFAQIVNPTPGIFVDIGCSIPSFQSNTKALLERGWKGFCVDIEPRHEEWKEFPNARFFQADARTFDWSAILPVFTFVDYASVDVDILTYNALENLIKCGCMMRCATVEHDSYRFGEMMQHLQQELMKRNHYIMVAEDISSNGCCYEDWYVHESVKDLERIKKEVALCRE